MARPSWRDLLRTPCPSTGIPRAAPLREQTSPPHSGCGGLWMVLTRGTQSAPTGRRGTVRQHAGTPTPSARTAGAAAETQQTLLRPLDICTARGSGFRAHIRADAPCCSGAGAQRRCFHQGQGPAPDSLGLRAAWLLRRLRPHAGSTDSSLDDLGPRETCRRLALRGETPSGAGSTHLWWTSPPWAP